MDYDYFILFIIYRMGVLVIWLSISCPSCVPETNGRRLVKSVHMQKLFEVADFTSFLLYEYTAVGHNGNSCRIISPVFEFLKPFQYYRECLFFTYISNYSAHFLI